MEKRIYFCDECRKEIHGVNFLTISIDIEMNQVIGIGPKNYDLHFCPDDAKKFMAKYK